MCSTHFSNTSHCSFAVNSQRYRRRQNCYTMRTFPNLLILDWNSWQLQRTSVALFAAKSSINQSQRSSTAVVHKSCPVGCHAMSSTLECFSHKMKATPSFGMPVATEPTTHTRLGPSHRVHQTARMEFNLLALELDIYSLEHHLCKMWIFYETRRVTLGNTRHFVERNKRRWWKSKKKKN